MMRVPGFNPLAPIGEGLGRGLEEGIKLGVNRGMLKQGLSAIESLYTPDAQGNIQAANPATVLSRLSMAFGHMPGGPQMISELFPSVMEQISTARLRQDMANSGGMPGTTAGGMPGMGGGFGQQQGTAGASPLQYLMAGGQSGQMIQPQSTAGLLPEQPSPPMMRRDQAQMRQPGQPGQMARDIAPVSEQFVSKNMITPENIAAVQRYAYSNLPMSKAPAFVDNWIKQQQAAQQSEIAASSEQRASQERALASNKASQDFLDKKITQNKYSDPFLENEARLKFEDERARNPNMGDERRWQIANRHADSLKNKITALKVKDVGRPLLGSLDEKQFNKRKASASQAAQQYAKSAKIYDDETGEFNLPAYEKGIDALMANEWLREEAHDMLIGTSTGVRGAAISAPSAIQERTAATYWKPDELRRKSPDDLDQNYEFIARSLIENLQPTDSLRNMRTLLKPKGYEEEDFTNIIQNMFSYGWEPSPLQEKDLAEMAGAIQPGVVEAIYGGEGIQRIFQRPNL